MSINEDALGRYILTLPLKTELFSTFSDDRDGQLCQFYI